MRVSSGLRVSISKTHRDETKQKRIFQPDHSGLPQQQNTGDLPKTDESVVRPAGERL